MHRSKEPYWQTKCQVILTYFTAENTQKWARIGIFKPAEPHWPTGFLCMILSFIKGQNSARI